MSTIREIRFKSLKREDVDFFKRKDLLFSTDFRATAEHEGLSIEEMRAYENYAYLLSGNNPVHVVVNDTYGYENTIIKKPKCQLYIAPTSKDPRKSGV